jgi:hypothetical protein
LQLCISHIAGTWKVRRKRRVVGGLPFSVRRSSKDRLRSVDKATQGPPYGYLIDTNRFAVLASDPVMHSRTAIRSNTLPALRRLRTW